MAKDILNLTRLGTNDGGSQTACSFLEQLASLDDSRAFCVAAFSESNTGLLAKKLNFETMLFERRTTKRVRLDLECRKIFEEGQLCFTFHGAPWFRSMGYLNNVCGAADSNLYYPEINFWKHLAPVKRGIKKIKDVGRMYGYSRADHWIFETQELARRAIDLAKYPKERVSVVKMSASAFVSPSRIDHEKRSEFARRIGNGFSLLFMAGANPNKRIINVVPAIKDAMSVLGSSIRVVTTLDESTDYYRILDAHFRKYGIRSAWINLGPVAIEEISSLIDASDVVCLFSVLESFSSNFTEAWAMRKPLMVTDSDWSRSACGDAARYVDPADASQLSQTIIELHDPMQRGKLLSRYSNHYSTYPTAEARCDEYLKCLDAARQIGKMSKKMRQSVKRFRSDRSVRM